MNQSEAKKHLTGLKKIITDQNIKMTENRMSIKIEHEFNNKEKCRIAIYDSLNMIFEQFINRIAIYTRYHNLNYYLAVYKNDLVLTVYN
jgi:hypothetical protein